MTPISLGSWVEEDIEESVDSGESSSGASETATGDEILRRVIQQQPPQQQEQVPRQQGQDQQQQQQQIQDHQQQQQTSQDEQQQQQQQLQGQDDEHQQHQQGQDDEQQLQGQDEHQQHQQGQDDEQQLQGQDEHQQHQQGQDDEQQQHSAGVRVLPQEMQALAYRTQEHIMQGSRDTQERIATESKKQADSLLRVFEGTRDAMLQEHLPSVPDVHLPSVPHRALRSQVVSSADMNSDLAMTTDNEAWANNPIYGSKHRLKWGKNLSTRMMVQETPILTTIDGERRWIPRVKCSHCGRVFPLKPGDLAPTLANDDIKNHARATYGGCPGLRVDASTGQQERRSTSAPRSSPASRMMSYADDLR